MGRVVERSFSEDALDWVANLPNDRYEPFLAYLSSHSLFRLVVFNNGQFNTTIRRIMRRKRLNAAQLDYILYKRYQEMLAKNGMSA